MLNIKIHIIIIDQNVSKLIFYKKNIIFDKILTNQLQEELFIFTTSMIVAINNINHCIWSSYDAFITYFYTWMHDIKWYILWCINHFKHTSTYVQILHHTSIWIDALYTLKRIVKYDDTRFKIISYHNIKALRLTKFYKTYNQRMYDYLPTLNHKYINVLLYNYDRINTPSIIYIDRIFIHSIWSAIPFLKCKKKYLNFHHIYIYVDISKHHIQNDIIKIINKAFFTLKIITTFVITGYQDQDIPIIKWFWWSSIAIRMNVLYVPNLSCMIDYIKRHLTRWNIMQSNDNKHLINDKNIIKNDIHMIVYKYIKVRTKITFYPLNHFTIHFVKPLNIKLSLKTLRRRILNHIFKTYHKFIYLKFVLI